MAAADYRLCDVCGRKAFYDANLNYEYGRTKWNEDDPPFRTNGVPQPEGEPRHELRCDYLGEWAVICGPCASTHKCVVVSIEVPTHNVGTSAGDVDSLRQEPA